MLFLMPGSAWAEEDLLAKYRAESDHCYAQSETSVGKKACNGLLSGVCMDEEPGGQSTQGMVRCTRAETFFWDEKLNEAYALALADVKAADADDKEYTPEFAVRQDRLRDAQRAWIAFRDAQCGFDYSIWGSGSMSRVWGASCLSQMTFERVLDLLDIQETL